MLGAECSSPAHPGHEWFVKRYDRTVEDFAAKFTFDQAQHRLPRDHDPHALAELPDVAH